jgi:dTDP-4-amino-4,6-dideoxy-D-galactose acyltransferase
LILRVEKDEWLSHVLGVSSWKVSGIKADTSAAEIKADLFECADHGSAFFSAKIPTSDIRAVTNATRGGFVAVDVNVTFDWNKAAGGAAENGETDSDMTIETAAAGDAAAIEEIAGRCFTRSRFHLDPAIGIARANEIKRQWARNACRGRASTVYVARRHSDVVGFLAVLESRSDGAKDAIIDLVGVDSNRQGQGAGRALSRMFVEQWRGRADRLRVGTQISNIPAMRLYESIGFRVTETSYVLHAHAIDGALAA